MNASILVAYATRYGSTREVAEAVAAALREHELPVDIQPISAVQILDAYSAVVLGAPLYMGHWHMDALQFLARKGNMLREQPIAVFALGPLHDDATEFQDARAQLEHDLAPFVWLTPVAIELFGGRYDPAKLSFTDRIIARLPASPLHALPASDVRNWVAIRAWANTLALQFGPAVPRA